MPTSANLLHPSSWDARDALRDHFAKQVIDHEVLLLSSANFPFRADRKVEFGRLPDLLLLLHCHIRRWRSYRWAFGSRLVGQSGISARLGFCPSDVIVTTTAEAQGVLVAYLKSPSERAEE